MRLPFLFPAKDGEQEGEKPNIIPKIQTYLEFPVIYNILSHILQFAILFGIFHSFYLLPYVTYYQLNCIMERKIVMWKRVLFLFFSMPHLHAVNCMGSCIPSSYSVIGAFKRWLSLHIVFARRYSDSSWKDAVHCIFFSYCC